MESYGGWPTPPLAYESGSVTVLLCFRAFCLVTSFAFAVDKPQS